MILFKNPRFSIYFLLAVLLSVLLLSACRTRKASVDKSKETVSRIEQKDVVMEEKERINTSVIDLRNTENWSVSSVDSKKPAEVVYKGDTLSLLNAKLEVQKTDSRTKTTTAANRDRRERDNSSTEFESKSKTKKKSSEVQSASWGLNLGIILGIAVLAILAYLHFNKPS